MFESLVEFFGKTHDHLLSFLLDHCDIVSDRLVIWLDMLSLMNGLTFCSFQTSVHIHLERS